MSDFMKIHLVGAKLFHVDGQTGQIDMTKLMVALRNCTKLCLKQHVSGQDSLH